ncbi:hypothetical protein IAT40_004515 [Kwoniella sp. CBS 6097]
MFGNELLLSGEIVPNIWDDKNEAVQLYSKGRSNYSIPNAPSTRSSSVPRPKAPDVPDSVDPLYPSPPAKVYAQQITSTSSSAPTPPVEVLDSNTGTVDVVQVTPEPSITGTTEASTELELPPVTIPTEPRTSTGTQTEASSLSQTKTVWSVPFKIWTGDSPTSEMSTHEFASLPEGTAALAALTTSDMTQDTVPSTPGAPTTI